MQVLKKLFFILIISIVSVGLLVSCGGDDEEEDNPEVLNDGFIRGFDASEVDFYEDENGVTWYDTTGNERDFFKILAAHGVNTVRLRIWNDPSQFSSSVNTGMNDLNRTVSMAKRVNDAGLALMLDFHYSDTWADPGRQIVPNAWKDLTSADTVASKLSTYTTSVLTTLKEAGVTPSYVQIGNELNSGMMTAYKGTSSTDNTASGTFACSGTVGTSVSTAANLIKYLKAGANAVRAFDSSIKIVIHVASTGSDLSWFYERIDDVDYDIIGLSYYPWESSHGTISTLKSNLETLASTFDKDVMVVECSSHWADESSKSAQNYTYQHMVDPDTGSVYSDLETAKSGSNTYVVGSVQNQANVIYHIMEETADSGGIGVFAWGGDLYGNYKWGMFDSSCKALDSIDVFSSDITISSASSSNSTSTGIVSSIATSASYTADGTESLLASASLLSGASSKITVSISSCDWTGCSLSSGVYYWVTTYSDSSWTKVEEVISQAYDSLSSAPSSGKLEISDSSIISTLKTNGLYIAGLSGLSCNVTVSVE